MAGVCEQLSPDQLADPSGEDSGPQFTTFVLILASGRKELLYGHPDLHGGVILLVLYEFFFNEAHKALTGCKGMQESEFRLSSSRHTFSFLAASMVFTLLVAAERRQAAEAFSTGSTSEQKKYVRLCGAGDGSSELANIEDCGFCQELTRLLVFSKTAELPAKRLSPLLPPSPSPPPPQTPLPQTPETLAEHIEKAQKILDFLFEGRSTDEVMFRATMSILFAYKEVIPGDDLLFLAIYQELMTLYRRHCPQLLSVYWRYFGL
ncbi:hypothetical protein TYRP_022412 [Tyrophagus putrescentiae]|nr:hypothetical protein TYRP_022412 [Tyrophagus putrescentiae]